MNVDDIQSRLRARGRSQKFLADYLDLDASSLTKSLKGRRRFQAAELAKLEEFFGERLEVEDLPLVKVSLRPNASKIPVYGYAAAGGGEFIAITEYRVLDHYDAPPYWNGSGELIYVRIIGDSMEPRYFSGEVVPVRLNVPPAKGADALIEFYDETAVIKSYRGMRDGRVFAWQYNPDMGVDYDATKVKALHSIWKPGVL